MYLPKRISAIGNRPQKKVVYVSPLQGLIFHTACPGDAFSIVSQRAVAAFFLLPNNGDIDAAALKRHSTQPTLAASVRKVTLHREKERERKQKKSTKRPARPEDFGSGKLQARFSILPQSARNGRVQGKAN
ncbi:uncharacterized protein LOC121593711 isoform X2 [Anopheles merus]|uniref:uncharacterized protein LOC121593711 isoform X2 n=1 Tax=Anopheles merus TaxID=30066 RepID=UPI001BE4950C|nr:uncharacterized protein LOC121593711 isoform X2 [Anopheles merus]